MKKSQSPFQIFKHSLVCTSFILLASCQMPTTSAEHNAGGAEQSGYLFNIGGNSGGHDAPAHDTKSAEHATAGHEAPAHGGEHAKENSSSGIFGSLFSFGGGDKKSEHTASTGHDAPAHGGEHASASDDSSSSIFGSLFSFGGGDKKSAHNAPAHGGEHATAGHEAPAGGHNNGDSSGYLFSFGGDSGGHAVPAHGGGHATTGHEAPAHGNAHTKSAHAGGHEAPDHGNEHATAGHEAPAGGHDSGDNSGYLFSFGGDNAGHGATDHGGGHAAPSHGAEHVTAGHGAHDAPAHGGGHGSTGNGDYVNDLFAKKQQEEISERKDILYGDDEEFITSRGFSGTYTNPKHKIMGNAFKGKLGTKGWDTLLSIPVKDKDQYDVHRDNVALLFKFQHTIHWDVSRRYGQKTISKLAFVEPGDRLAKIYHQSLQPLLNFETDIQSVKRAGRYYDYISKVKITISMPSFYTYIDRANKNLCFRGKARYYGYKYYMDVAKSTPMIYKAMKERVAQKVRVIPVVVDKSNARAQRYLLGTLKDIQETEQVAFDNYYRHIAKKHNYLLSSLSKNTLCLKR